MPLQCAPYWFYAAVFSLSGCLFQIRTILGKQRLNCQIPQRESRFEQGMELLSLRLWICFVIAKHHLNEAAGKLFVLMTKRKVWMRGWGQRKKICCKAQSQPLLSLSFVLRQLTIDQYSCVTQDICSKKVCATFFFFLLCRAKGIRVAFQRPQDMNTAFSSTPNTDIIYEDDHHQLWSEPCLPVLSSWPPTVFFVFKTEARCGVNTAGIQSTL